MTADAPPPWVKFARHLHVVDGHYRLAYSDCPCIGNGMWGSFIPKPVPPKRFLRVEWR